MNNYAVLILCASAVSIAWAPVSCVADTNSVIRAAVERGVDPMKVACASRRGIISTEACTKIAGKRDNETGGAE